MSVKRRLTRVATAGGLAILAGLLACGAGISWPVSSAVLNGSQPQGVSVEDRNGASLRTTRAADGSQTQWVPYDRIDPDLINAFVAVEDHRFWDHHGPDVGALARGTRDNVLAHGIVSGASTITMQLARLISPSERTWGGKLAQTLWAFRLEAHLDKQQILEQYLNRVNLGQATTGVGAASSLYFDAPASNVSIG